MFVEIALSQKLVLYLGHPVYALSVVLFSMLLLSGVGSIVCGRITPAARRRFIAFLPFVVLMAILFMPPVLAATLHQSFAVRVLVTLLFAGTLAFFMGMPFPSRIMHSEEREVPVYWGVNGFFSVVASVLTVLISINMGFTAVFIVAFVLYALAAVIYVRRFS
jgi:CDP-diglyceride synthetase